MMLSCVPGFAAASTPAIEGTWTVTGSATVTSSTSALFNLKATVLKNKEVNDTWIFESGTLSTFNLGTVGSYTVNSRGQVTVPTSELIAALEADINSSLPTDLAGVTITVTSLTFPPVTVKTTKTGATFSESVTGKGNIEATIYPNHLGQAITVNIEVQVVLSGVKASSGVLTSANEGKDAASVISKFVSNKVVTPILSRVAIQ